VNSLALHAVFASIQFLHVPWQLQYPGYANDARAEGEGISCSRQLLHRLSALTKPAMHTKLAFK